MIHADTRERPSGVPAALEALGLLVEVHLDPIDYWWDSVIGLVAVERKAGADFVRSLRSERYAAVNKRVPKVVRQLHSANAAVKVLIIEGSIPVYYDFDRKEQMVTPTWSAKMVRRFLYRLDLNAIIRYNTTGAEDTANTLGWLYSVSTKASTSWPLALGELERKAPQWIL